MTQKKIEIDIPEGKVPIIEQTENGVVITWKEKELTYTELLNEFGNNLNCIHTSFVNLASQAFHKKVEVLRKLINIRNYFWKPKHFCDGIVIKCVNSYCGVETGQFYFDKPDLDSPHQVIFDKKSMLNKQLKCLVMS